MIKITMVNGETYILNEEVRMFCEKVEYAKKTEKNYVSVVSEQHLVALYIDKIVSVKKIEV